MEEPEFIEDEYYRELGKKELDFIYKLVELSRTKTELENDIMFRNSLPHHGDDNSKIVEEHYRGSINKINREAHQYVADNILSLNQNLVNNPIFYRILSQFD